MLERKITFFEMTQAQNDSIREVVQENGKKLFAFINFWQSIGLMLLTRILFRGFHGMQGRGIQYGNWGG